MGYSKFSNTRMIVHAFIFNYDSKLCCDYVCCMYVLLILYLYLCVDIFERESKQVLHKKEKEKMKKKQRKTNDPNKLLTLCQSKHILFCILLVSCILIH